MPTWNTVMRVVRMLAIVLAASSADMLVAAAKQELQGQSPQAAWPDNEPAGMTPTLTIDGSSKDFGPEFHKGRRWRNDRRVEVVTDPDSKFGHAIEKRFFIGDRSGWNGITSVGEYGAYRELYLRIVFRLSPNWQYHSGMNKLFYYGGAGAGQSKSATQFFIGIRGGHLEFIDQSASGEKNSQGTFRANAPTIDRDRYHTVEVLHVANTPGQSDGSVRMWIDGAEVPSFNHLGRPDRDSVQLKNLRWLDYDDTRLTGVEAFMFWGGQRDTKRVNDWIRLSELYISGKN